MQTNLLELGAQLLHVLNEAPKLLKKVASKDEKLLASLQLTQYSHLLKPNLHVFHQDHENSSLGWSTVGGDGFTEYYAIVVEVPFHEIAAVYIGGRAAYITRMDEAYKHFVGLRNMPTWNDREKMPNLLWEFVFPAKVNTSASTNERPA